MTNMINMIREKLKLLFPSVDEYLLGIIVKDLREKATNYSLQMLIKELDKAIAESREVFKQSVLRSKSRKPFLAQLENSDKEFQCTVEELTKKYLSLTEEERKKLQEEIHKAIESIKK